MVRFRLLIILAGAAFAGAVAIQGSPQLGQPEIRQDHVTWVAQALKRIQTVKPWHDTGGSSESVHHGRRYIHGSAMDVRQSRLSLF